MTLIAAGTVITGEQVHSPGWLRLDGARVAAVGAGPPPQGAVEDLGNAVLVPGFVDLHVHGGGGRSFDAAGPDTGPQAVLTAAEYHRRHGTTTLLAGLVTSELPRLRTALAQLAELTADGAIGGVLLEGPWLSVAHPGAHDVPLLRDPDPAEVAGIIEAGRGAVRMVTLAPERPGGLDAVRVVVDAGAVAAVGHTGADHAQTLAAIDAGATVATHLFNGMPPVHHRAPGPVVALLDDDRVTLELIADGVHLHPATVAHVWRSAPGRVAMVTDAMAAAGMPDGAYPLGELVATVTDGVARLADGTIAGSTVTMDSLFRAAFSAGGSLLGAAVACSVTPARAVGLDDVGALLPGRFADAVALSSDLAVTGVLHRGAWAQPPT